MTEQIVFTHTHTNPKAAPSLPYLPFWALATKVLRAGLIWWRRVKDNLCNKATNVGDRCHG